MEEKLTVELSKVTGVKLKLLNWDRNISIKEMTLMYQFKQKSPSMKLKLADKLVLKKIRKAIGFDNMILASTGSAPTNFKTKMFYLSLGIPLVEG